DWRGGRAGRRHLSRRRPPDARREDPLAAQVAAPRIPREAAPRAARVLRMEDLVQARAPARRLGSRRAPRSAAATVDAPRGRPVATSRALALRPGGGRAAALEARASGARCDRARRDRNLRDWKRSLPHAAAMWSQGAR